MSHTDDNRVTTRTAEKARRLENLVLFHLENIPFGSWFVRDSFCWILNSFLWNICALHTEAKKTFHPRDRKLSILGTENFPP